MSRMYPWAEREAQAGCTLCSKRNAAQPVDSQPPQKNAIRGTLSSSQGRCAEAQTRGQIGSGGFSAICSLVEPVHTQPDTAAALQNAAELILRRRSDRCCCGRGRASVRDVLGVQSESSCSSFGGKVIVVDINVFIAW